MYLFMDESGCLGFEFHKKKTSKYFVVTCLFAPSKRPLEKIVKKVHGGLRQQLHKHSGVLHCNKEKPATRQRLLKLLSEKDCAIMAIYLNKRKVYTRLQDEKHVLYNYVTNILLDRIFSKRYVPETKKIMLIASKRETNKFLNENFSSYLNRKVTDMHNIEFTVEIKTPADEKCLQVVDFVSWAIFRKYEYGDDGYYNLIKEKVMEENPLFP
ncbi:MAG TPA: hypothetical protein DHO02_04665 [Syntrophaceae bacterium]|jgi:hypothetical protein|nr:hypothetical protein [Syntrophaceae bacterium]HCS76765.1 hypothetical protein [Syntrophaceae bacterium]HCX01688.1 hypothetical protein [Syntrophaceae bacterium]